MRWCYTHRTLNQALADQICPRHGYFILLPHDNALVDH